MFFDAEDYLRLRDRVAAAGCDMPIIPGIMPVTNVAQIERFAAAVRARRSPPTLAARLHAVADDPAAVRARRRRGAPPSCASELLAEGAPGLHFYTLNRSTATREIYAALALGSYA